jgi:putative exosortase-associated protein (TIGR04073 family)
MDGEKRFTTAKIRINLGRTIHFMRNILSLPGVITLAAFLAAGCAGPEQKMGRGLSNSTEILRAGEFQRGVEQGGLMSGPDTGFASGFVAGANKTFARTGIGIFEIVTFPLPPYRPLCTDYLNPKPQYPDSYHPRKWADPMFDSDHYLGFSGGDVAPWFPGSKFRVFDN